MTEAERERACEPFFTTKDEHAGTGLGLSSVYGFVRQSQGDMHIRSAPGAGTSIMMAFPITAESSQMQESSEKPSAGLDGIRLLLAEDNAILARTLVAMIEHLGAEVRHFSTGDEALEHIAIHDDFDVVLSDIRMPGKMDGFALYSWVREHRPQLPVLLMSGFNDSVDTEDGVIVLSKPFGQQELSQALRSVMATQ